MFQPKNLLRIGLEIERRSKWRLIDEPVLAGRSCDADGSFGR